MTQSLRKHRRQIIIEDREPMPRPAIHPGEILADELTELKITPTELSRQLSVPPNRISQIIQGKRAITGDTARFASATGSRPARSSGSICNRHMICAWRRTRSGVRWRLADQSRQGGGLADKAQKRDRSPTLCSWQRPGLSLLVMPNHSMMWRDSIAQTPLGFLHAKCFTEAQFLRISTRVRLVRQLCSRADENPPCSSTGCNDR
jgi:addiction module HigA family antidote